MPEWVTSYVIPPGFVVAGIVLLMWAGDRLVEHSAHLAASLRVPPVIVGAVILGFGTSAPEFVFSMISAHKGQPVLAIANVVGSNIANVGLILGLGAFMATVHVDRRLVRLDLPLGILGVLLLILWAGPAGVVSLWLGAVLLGLFAGYLYVCVNVARAHRRVTEPPDVPRRLGVDIGWIVFSLVGITVGAELLRAGAVDVARLAGVSERVIGITMVALGTSLPELAATIAAARKKRVELAVGNIAGSNIFNIFFVLGSVALTKDIPVPPLMGDRDFPALAIFSLLAFPLLLAERRLGKRQGGLLLVLYAGYILWCFFSER
jgi:cation:H+ antiporter